MLGSILKDLFAASRSRGSANLDSEVSVRVPEQKEGGSVIAFAPGSEGNALAELTHSMVQPFERLASRVRVLDIATPRWREELAEMLDDPVWFAISFFGAGQRLEGPEGDGRINIWEAGGIPFVRLYGDIPAYFPDRHLGHYRNSVNGYFYRDHADYYRHWFRSAAISVVVSPMLVDAMPLEQVDVARKTQGKIIFPKNGNSPNGLRAYWRTSLPQAIATALEAVGEELTARGAIDDEPNVAERLVQYFFRLGVDITADRTMLCFLVAQLDDYLRRVKSTMIVTALLDLPVLVRGRFWEHIDFRGRRATYDGNSDVATTQALIDQAPALVDMAPNTQHAPHDRICRAAGRGTAFITNRQQFLSTVVPNADRFSFPFVPDSIAAMVDHYATHPKQAIELGLEQASAFRAAYPESAYVRSILSGVQLALLRLRGRPPGTQSFVDYRPDLSF
jgi:hypothetical protein